MHHSVVAALARDVAMEPAWDSRNENAENATPKRRMKRRTLRNHIPGKSCDALEAPVDAASSKIFQNPIHLAGLFVGAQTAQPVHLPEWTRQCQTTSHDGRPKSTHNFIPTLQVPAAATAS